MTKSCTPKVGKTDLLTLALTGDFRNTVWLAASALTKAKNNLNCSALDAVAYFATVWRFVQQERAFTCSDNTLYFDTLIRAEGVHPVYACATWNTRDDVTQPLAAVALVRGDAWDNRVAPCKPRVLTLPKAPLPSVEEVAAIKIFTSSHLEKTPPHLIRDDLHRFPRGLLVSLCRQYAPNSALMDLLLEAEWNAARYAAASAFLENEIPHAFNTGRLGAKWASALHMPMGEVLHKIATLPCNSTSIAQNRAIALQAKERLTQIMGHEDRHDGAACDCFRADLQRYRPLFRALCDEVLRAFQEAVAELRRGAVDLVPILQVTDGFRPHWLLPFQFRDGSLCTFIVKRNTAGHLYVPTILPARLAERDALLTGSTLRWSK